MRAVCERCAAPQPNDWVAGDLCAQCGGPARREERCFWCNTWSPAGGYCRSCGAEQLGEASYGAARMLTRTGAGMFEIPKLVREMDPGRLAVFAGQYARQRAVIARHVDDLAFVESALSRRGFAGALEEEWVASLPWSEAQLAENDVVASRAAGGLQRIRELGERSIVEVTRALAPIARLWMRDWSALREVARLARGSDQIGAEAALALTWWRTMTALSLGRVQIAREAVQVLEEALPAPQAAVRLALLGREVPEALLAEAALSADPDLAFAAALARGDVAPLTAALRADDAEMQQAAALALARQGALEPLVAWFSSAPAQAQAEVAGALQRRKGAPAGPLTEALLRLMQSTEESGVRVDCGIVLARAAPVELAVQVAAASQGEIYVVQALMSEGTGLAPHELARVAAALAGSGWLRAGTYGVSEAAARGAFPEELVPQLFASASDEARLELCRIAEVQLGAGAGESLHSFLLRAVFGPYDGKVRAAAWWSLARWYAKEKYGWMGPLELTPESIARFFPGVPAFLEGFTAVLGDLPTLQEVGLYDFLQRLVAGLDAGRVRALAESGDRAQALAAAMERAAEMDVWSPLRDSLRRAVALFAAESKRRAGATES